MELFKKEYLIRIENNQNIIVPKSFLKMLILDNNKNITSDTICEYIALDEICEIQRYKLDNQEYIKFALTEKGNNFLMSQRNVSNNEINQYIAKNNIVTYKEPSYEYQSGK